MNCRIAIALMLLTSFAPVALPCECAEWQPLCARLPADTANAKDVAAFLGTVEGIEQPANPRLPTRVRFSAPERLAGPNPSPAEVNTSHIGEGGCGYPFKPGERYLVVAQLHNGAWYTSGCTGTTTAATATRSIEFLRARLRGEPVAPSVQGLVIALTRKDLRSISDPDLEIRLRNLQTGETKQTHTDSIGRFFFDNLKPGRYEVDLPSGSGWRGIVEEAPLKWPVDLTRAACAGATLYLLK